MLKKLSATRQTANKKEQGFTLLEVMIAMAIMLISLASILAVESNSINATRRAKQLNIVAMLARGRMIKLESEFEGKTFSEFRKEDGGNFDEPYQDYRWSYKVKELTFPNIGGGGGGDKGEGASGGAAESGGGMAEMVTKLLTKYLSKSLREVALTVFWKRGSGEQSFTVATYWVDLTHEFELTE